MAIDVLVVCIRYAHKGICTYLRGLMLFILVVGSCRNLRTKNGQVFGSRFLFVYSILQFERTDMETEQNVV